MRIAFLIGALVASAIAFPRPQDDPTDDDPSDDANTISLPFPDPTVPAILTTSLNVPVTASLARPTSRRSQNPHWEPIPVFTKACTCNVATVRYPCWATDALQKCNYEENFSYACYMEAAGGCPTPTRVCKNLYKPTPVTGRHPCDFGGSPPPLITPAPNTTTLIPVVPSVNVTLPGFTTTNITLPILSTANVTLSITLPVRH